MSNKRNQMPNDLPTMANPPKPSEPVVKPPEPPVSAPTRADHVTIEIPYIAEPPKSAGHQDEAHRLDMGDMTRERMRKVKALRRGYIAENIRMAGGFEVKTNRDAMYCLLDQLDI